MTILLSTSKSFSKRLSDLITTENISRRHLCSKIHAQRKSLYGWLNGGNYPKYDSLIRLADYFKVSINFLLGISDETYSPEHCAIGAVQKQFILKLATYLEENSLTRYAFAKSIKVGLSNMKRWFNCGSMPETAALIRIAKVMGQTVDYLLGYN